MNLILASNNAGKIAEIKALLPGFNILTMKEAGFGAAIEEPFDTFRENAFIKAHTVFSYCQETILADDSGLCVEALGGAPGVFSARYAGDKATEAANNEKLLRDLRAVTDRKAYYIAVLCLVTAKGAVYFEGRCDGTIAERPFGKGGFGYDPLFIPDGYAETFAELPMEIKAKVSHRAKALQKLKTYLSDSSYEIHHR